MDNNRPSFIRDFDQISEEGVNRRSARLGKLVLVSLAGGCLAFALMAHWKRTAPTATQAPDPLGDLVAKGKGSAPASSGLAGAGVSFPSMLSDAPQTTTALAVVHDHGAGVAAVAAAPAAVAPPPASDRLRVVPLPGGDHATPGADRSAPALARAAAVVARGSVAGAAPGGAATPDRVAPTAPTKDGATPPAVSDRPRDTLTEMAKESAAPSGPTSEAGHAGGYQLQASSFPTEPEATAFATSLRQRGHRAYVESAQIPGRGQWYRVRIGPFTTKRDAAQYRVDFERREHIAPYLVDPNQTATDSAHPRGTQALREPTKENGEARPR